MTITFAAEDGTILDTVFVTDTPRPDYKDAEDELKDDNIYFDERSSVLDACESSLKYLERQLAKAKERGD